MTDPIEIMARAAAAHVKKTPEYDIAARGMLIDDWVDVQAHALAALRETLVPVGWRYDHNVFGTAFYRERQEMKRLGPDTTETPLYALAADFLSPFILPEPEPDPLVELMAFNGLDEALAEQRATNLRKDAADLGYKIIVERIEQ